VRFRVVAPAPTYIGSRAEIQPCLDRCWDTDLLAVDTETLGKESEYIKMVDQVVGMGLCPDEGVRYFVPRKYLHHFQDLLASGIPKALHNYKFDGHRLLNGGCALGGDIEDTLMYDVLYDEDTRENRHGLDDCSMDYFAIPMAKYRDIVPAGTDPRSIVPGHPLWLRYLDYGSLDAWVTRKLALFHRTNLSKIFLFTMPVFEKQIKDKEMTFEDASERCSKTLLDHYWEYEEPQIQVLFNMERRGIAINLEHLEGVAESMRKEMDACAAELSKIAGYPLNPNSTKQMGKWLFEDLGLTPLAKTKTGAASVDEATIKHFAAKGVQGLDLVLRYKKASKLRGTYALGLAKWVHSDGKIHTSYSPTKVTGRLASATPNLQNIPRPDWDVHKIRAAFIPDCEDDILIVCDYGQLEMRILASAAEAYGDPTMAEGIRKGMDMHSYTGAIMINISYEEFVERKNQGDEFILDVRQAAKAINFGIVYGIAAQGLSRQLTDALKRPVTELEAQNYIDAYFKAFPGVVMYMASQKSSARNIGYVQTIAGRFRRLSAASSRRPQERNYAYRQAINAPIQGSAADIVKDAMIKLDRNDHLRETLGCTLRMQVHDEFVFNLKGGALDEALVAECIEIIQSTMVGCFSGTLTVPLIADPAVCRTWSEAKA
jgi:DNA polymerase I-like protein with 3'-5' exonuclease and polymerase domains